jgi:hypothetical protein
MSSLKITMDAYMHPLHAGAPFKVHSLALVAAQPACAIFCEFNIVFICIYKVYVDTRNAADRSSDLPSPASSTPHDCAPRPLLTYLLFKFAWRVRARRVALRGGGEGRARVELGEVEYGIVRVEYNASQAAG